MWLSGVEMEGDCHVLQESFKDLEPQQMRAFVSYLFRKSLRSLWIIHLFESLAAVDEYDR